MYVASSGSSNVSAFSIAPDSGVLTQISGSPFTAGSTPVSVVVDASDQFLYVGPGLESLCSFDQFAYRCAKQRFRIALFAEFDAIIDVHNGVAPT